MADVRPARVFIRSHAGRALSTRRYWKRRRVKWRAVSLGVSLRRRFVRDAARFFDLRAYLVGVNRRLVLVSGKK